MFKGQIYVFKLKEFSYYIFKDCSTCWNYKKFSCLTIEFLKFKSVSRHCIIKLFILPFLKKKKSFGQILGYDKFWFVLSCVFRSLQLLGSSSFSSQLSFTYKICFIFLKSIVLDCGVEKSNVYLQCPNNYQLFSCWHQICI